MSQTNALNNTPETESFSIDGIENVSNRIGEVPSTNLLDTSDITVDHESYVKISLLNYDSTSMIVEGIDDSGIFYLKLNKIIIIET